MCFCLHSVFYLPFDHDVVTNLERGFRFVLASSPYQLVPLLLPLLGDCQVSHGQRHYPFECLPSVIEEDLHFLVGRVSVELHHGLVSPLEDGVSPKYGAVAK